MLLLQGSILKSSRNDEELDKTARKRKPMTGQSSLEDICRGFR